MTTQVSQIPSEEILCIVGEEGDLGEGAYGRVRCGFHQEYGIVAAKCCEIKGGKREIALLRKQIMKEIDVLQRAKHENIVTVHGFSRWKGAVAIIMECVFGGNLQQMLVDDDVIMTPLFRLRLCCEIANGLAFIHKLSSTERLVHGDMKPGNILITERLHCKIADFGGARVSAYTATLSTRTPDRDSHSNMYTPFYAAPEVLENPWTKMKPSCDTYSFSMIVYSVLCRDLPVITEDQRNRHIDAVKSGRRPEKDFVSEMQTDLMRQKDEDGARIIEVLVEVMEDCWEQKPSSRPSMIDVKEKLHGLLASFNPDAVEEHAARALEGTDVEQPSQNQHECVPLNRFLPPDFSNIRESTTEITSPNTAKEIESATNKFSFSVSCKVFVNTQSCDQASLSNEQEKTVTSPTTEESSLSSVTSDQESTSAPVTSVAPFQKKLRRLRSLLKKDQIEEATIQSGELFSGVSKQMESDYEAIVQEALKSSSIFRAKGFYMSALKLVAWCVGVCHNIKSSTHKIKSLASCSYAVKEIADSMNNSGNKSEIKESALELLYMLRDEMQRVSTTEIEEKAEAEAYCQLYIALCLHYTDQHQEADETARSCISTLLSVFNNDAEKHKVLALCYLVRGAAAFNRSNYTASTIFFRNLIRLYQVVQDLSDEERGNLIEDAQKWLDRSSSQSTSSSEANSSKSSLC